MAVGIILLFVGASAIPSNGRNISNKQNDVVQLNETNRADVTITDTVGDVCSVDYLTQETSVVTYHPDIEVDNLDIMEATYTQQGVQVILSVQVVGSIENRGKIIDLYDGDIFGDLNFVEYDFQVSTSEQDYTISYANLTGQINNGTEIVNLTSSDYSVVGDTLSIWFSLTSAEELYENLCATSMFVKMNLTGDDPDITNFVYLSDIAPNPPLEIMDVYAHDTGYTGEAIQFNVNIIPLTGSPPLVYHWEFGDGFTSTQKNPTHVYSNPGVYTYNITVTDNSGATECYSGVITIYGMKKAILFGRFMDLISDGAYTTIEAVDLRMIPFQPFEYRHFIDGEQITFSNQYHGLIIANQFLIGIFDVAVGSAPPQTPNIAFVTDSTLNRITVATAEFGINWRDIAITLDQSGATYQVFYANSTAIAPVNNTANAGVAEVLAGDYIQLSTYSGNVRTTLRYIPTNSLLGTWTINV
jgi:PKD repeat protein